MKRVTTALVAASLAVSGMAHAQNAGNGSNAGLSTGIAPGTSSGAVTPGIGPSGISPTVGNIPVGGGMAPGPASPGAASQGAAALQGAMAPQGAAPAAGMNGGQHQATGVATTASPEPGANSFTRGQARSRLQRSGYTQVSGLHKDSQGVWRGKAMKDGQPASVSLDYQGNVTGQ